MAADLAAQWVSVDSSQAPAATSASGRGASAATTGMVTGLVGVFAVTFVLGLCCYCLCSVRTKAKRVRRSRVSVSDDDDVNLARPPAAAPRRAPRAPPAAKKPPKRPPKAMYVPTSGGAEPGYNQGVAPPRRGAKKPGRTSSKKPGGKRVEHAPLVCD